MKAKVGIVIAALILVLLSNFVSVRKEAVMEAEEGAQVQTVVEFIA